jgi:tetratricopeptide (TPR) repeat protein
LSVSRRWAAACVYAATREQLAPLERAARYAEELAETGAQAQTQNSLGWIHHVLGDYDAAERHYRSALHLAEAAQSQRLTAQLWANIGQNHSAAGEYEPAVAELSRAITTKRELARLRPGMSASTDGLAYALGCRGRVYADVGDFASADRDIAEAREVVGGSGRALEGSVLAIAAMVEILRGDWMKCIEYASASRKIAEQVNSDYVFATSSGYLAYARFISSGSDDALHQLQSSVDWLERRGTKLFLSFGYACLAKALVTASDFSAGEKYALRAIERASERDRLGEAIAYRVLARLRAVEDSAPDSAGMELHLAHAEEAARVRQSPREVAITRLAYATLFAELQPSAAGRAADFAHREFVRLGMKWHANRAERLLASLR